MNYFFRDINLPLFEKSYFHDVIKVYEDKGAIVIYCSEESFYTDSLGCIEPLFNHPANENDIRALAKELKVDINNKSFQF